MPGQGERKREPWKKPINHNTNKGRIFPTIVRNVEPNKGNWREQAACKGQPIELFFPERGGEGVTNTRKAREFCRICPVVEECLEYGLQFNDRHGVYGNTTPMQRRKIKRTLK